MPMFYTKKFDSSLVFDCQRNPVFPEANKLFSASGFSKPYGKNGQLTDSDLNGRYFQFSEATEKDSVTLNLMDNDGSTYMVISTGLIYGIGDEGFLYVGNGHYGYIFLAKPATGNSIKYTPKIGKATNADIDQLLNDSVIEPGAYTPFRSVTTDDLKILKEAMQGYVGLSFEPLIVATQVVSGFNYCFVGNGKPIVPIETSQLMQVHIHKPLAGTASIVYIERIQY